jgi:multicomponent Na+:H+ antiporter subunit E
MAVTMATEPTDRAAPPTGGIAGAAIARWLAYLLLWVILIGIDPLDFAVGAPTAALAAWASLRLLPPGTPGLRIAAAVALVPRFLWQSVVAGADVARRALAPGVPLKPGFATFAVGLPRGPLRNWFAAISSLMPGTVPVADEPRSLEYHCLDVSQPVAEQLKAEEEAWTPAFRNGALRSGRG